MIAKKSDDRRYQRTHQLIISNTIELAIANGWEKVSITKLAEKSNINRNSFYLHFERIEDVFDEIEDSFVSRYQEFVSSQPVLEALVNDYDYYSAFADFLKSEEQFATMINQMGRSNQLNSKVEKIWMKYLDEELSSLPEYRKVKDVILPYISGCTLIFFTNWFNDPTGFNIQKNTLFSGEFIKHILSMEPEKLY